MALTRFSTTSGDDKILLKGLPAKINSGDGNDTFFVENSMLRNFVIDGGTGVDNLQFAKSGIFTDLTFSNIERIDLAAGVTVTFSSEQLETAMESLTVNGIDAGLHFHGVTGDKDEIVRVTAQYAPYTFVPSITIKELVPTSYTHSELQLKNADLFHNVLNYLDFYKESLPEEDDDDEAEGDDDDDNPLVNDANVLAAYKNRKLVESESNDDDDDDFDEFVAVTASDNDDDAKSDDDDDDAESDDDDDDAESEDEESGVANDNDNITIFARADGSANDDYVLGSMGVDYATLGAGNDTCFGHDGNDLLVGGTGADLLSGGAGNDIFLITSFDANNPEWIDGDRIVGGAGIDTLRITSSAANKTELKLSDDNFQGMEIVEIGATVGRLNVEDTALQLLHNHYYLDTSGKIENADNVIIDASSVTKKGLTFIGNANKNTFIGTAKDDSFIGNGGKDLLTGGKGADKFVFGKVVTQTITGDTTTVQRYEETKTNLTDVDTVTDFERGKDKIVLEAEMFAVFEKNEGVLASNLIIGTQAKDANDYLIFNPTTKMLSYDADGNGKGAAIDIVILTGVTTLSASDFLID